MAITFDAAAAKYLELRAEVDRIEAAAKAQTAELKKIMLDLENWFTLKAQEEGLTTISTPSGTAYWSTHNTASVADPAAFRDYVVANKAFDLMETRASKTAVASFIEGNGVPPPGVNFSSVRVFNLRKAKKEL